MFILQVPTITGPGGGTTTRPRDDFDELKVLGDHAVAPGHHPNPPGTTPSDTTIEDTANQALQTDPSIYGPPSRDEYVDSSSPNARGFVSFPTVVQGVAVPASVAAVHGTQVAQAAQAWRAVRLGQTLPQGARLTRVASYAAKIPGFARVAEYGARYTSFLGRLGNVRYIGNVLKLGGGRVIPAIGAGLAALDVGMDWYNFATIKRQEGESQADFEARRSQARNDALINTGCTAAGAVIGGIIGSIIPGAGTVLGALIGAGIGNIVGNLFKGGGLGKIGRAIFGFFTGR